MVFMRAGIVVVAASTEDEANPSWRKITKSCPILEPQLEGRFWPNSVPDFAEPPLAERGM